MSEVGPFPLKSFKPIEIRMFLGIRVVGKNEKLESFKLRNLKWEKI